jgi:hypothetical protein
MARFARRVLALTALGAGMIGVVVAVSSGLGRQQAGPEVGVAAAEATRLTVITRTVRVAGVHVRVTRKPSGAVCFRARRVGSCASSMGSGRVVYATGIEGGRQVVAGVAGSRVRAVIARLTHRGTVWPALRSGVFCAVLPRGYRVYRLVAVLAGGRRVAVRAS